MTGRLFCCGFHRALAGGVRSSMEFSDNANSPSDWTSCQFFWQGQKDSNPRHAVLETAALPAELYPFVRMLCYYSAFSAACKGVFEKILPEGRSCPARGGCVLRRSPAHSPKEGGKSRLIFEYPLFSRRGGAWYNKKARKSAKLRRFAAGRDRHGPESACGPGACPQPSQPSPSSPDPHRHAHHQDLPCGGPVRLCVLFL